MKAEKEAAAKTGGDAKPDVIDPSAAEETKADTAKKAPASKPAAKGKKAGPGAAIAEKIRAQ